MKLQQGICIRSTAAMSDPIFTNTVVLITEMNADGAIGYILNQPFGRNLNELTAFSNSKPFPLHTGGPVDKENLYFIHRQPSLISGGQLVAADLYMGGNFREAVDAINADLLTMDDIKIFVGYCGWDAGELEAEIAERSWEVMKAIEQNFFRRLSENK
jgi:putative transcriptional regulator